MANATYRSAQTVFSNSTNVHISWIPETFGDYRHLWQFSPLPDTCVLFARKVLPDAAAVTDFFTDCDQLGFARECVDKAHTTSRHPDTPGRAPAAPHTEPEVKATQAVEIDPLPMHVPSFAQRLPEPQ